MEHILHTNRNLPTARRFSFLFCVCASVGFRRFKRLLASSIIIMQVIELLGFGFELLHLQAHAAIKCLPVFVGELL